MRTLAPGVTAAPPENSEFLATGAQAALRPSRMARSQAACVAFLSPSFLLLSCQFSPVLFSLLKKINQGCNAVVLFRFYHPVLAVSGIKHHLFLQLQSSLSLKDCLGVLGGDRDMPIGWTGGQHHRGGVEVVLQADLI